MCTIFSKVMFQKARLIENYFKEMLISLNFCWFRYFWAIIIRNCKKNFHATWPSLTLPNDDGFFLYYYFSFMVSPTFIRHDKYDITISYPRHYFHLSTRWCSCNYKITTKSYFDVRKFNLDTFMLLAKLLNMLFLVVFLTPKYWLYFESFWFWNASLLYSLQNNTLHHYIMIYRQHLSWNYIITVKIIVPENLVHIFK